jgi:hypothetical protein
MEMNSNKRARDKIYKRRDRFEIPDWQREEVWGTEKQRRLIDTILRGWKLPKFYFLKTSDSPEQFDVVDGQQRLNAIWEFLDGNLTLPDETTSEFGGKTYATLSPDISDAFDDYEIEYDEIIGATDEEIREFFQRLQEGVSLNSSERLNAVTSKLRDYCVACAKHDFFAKTISVANKRYGHFDIAAKVVTIELEGVDAGLRYDDVKKVFLANKTFSNQSAVAKRINKALDLLSKKLPAHWPLLRNRTIVQSLLTLTCHLLRSGVDIEKGSVLKEFIEAFITELGKQVEMGQQATDPDFIAFQRTVNANVRSGPQTRQDVLLRKLLQARPALFSAAGASGPLAGTIASNIKDSAESIRQLIATANDRYAAKNGHDLFKPTNKSTTALMALGKEIHSLTEYKALVDHLYFIFRESVGQRLGESAPQSFKDVNDLRTMIQHDVDHGKSSKVAAKNKGLAKVFEKFSGASTPAALDPAAFPLFQANVLSALEKDLHALTKGLA